MSKLNPEKVRSVCGRRPHWLGSLRVWERWEERDLRLILYKPGAVKLNHWTLPHRQALRCRKSQLKTCLSCTYSFSTSYKTLSKIDPKLPSNLGKYVADRSRSSIL